MLAAGSTTDFLVVLLAAISTSDRDWLVEIDADALDHSERLGVDGVSPTTILAGELVTAEVVGQIAHYLRDAFFMRARALA